ncbi:distal tail protein Dit [Finegoldia magna]|uniref:distal tail protein Dit n=1 Tax=Finegoldia magna TaxID=1260 RepID=UPI00399C1D8A
MLFYDGTDFRDLITVERIRRPVLSTTENRINDYVIFNGGDFINSRRKGSKFEIEFSYVQENLNNIRRLLGQLLGTDYLGELYFYDDPEVIYYAKVDGDLNVTEHKGTNGTKGYGKGVITFLIPSACGYKREPVEMSQANAKSIMCENKGTDKTYPIFDFTCHGKVTMIGVTSKHGSFQFGDSKEFAPIKQMKIHKEQTSSLFKSGKGTLTILDRVMKTSDGWDIVDASKLIADSDFYGKVSNTTTSSPKTPNGTVTVSKNARYWDNGVRIANWVKGKSFRFDKTKSVNKSKSKKAYRLLDKEGYIGWLLEEDIQGQSQSTVTGVYPVWNSSSHMTFSTLPLHRKVTNNATDWEMTFKFNYKANPGQFGFMTFGITDKDQNMIGGMRIETINGDGRMAMVCLCGDDGQLHTGYNKADWTGAVTITKKGAMVTYYMYNQLNGKSYTYRLMDASIDDVVASDVYVLCTKKNNYDFIQACNPMHMTITGYDADIYVETKSKEEFSMINVAIPRFNFNDGDTVRIDMNTGFCYHNGHRCLMPIAFGSKPTPIYPGVEEIAITTEGEFGSFVDCDVSYREVFKC